MAMKVVTINGVTSGEYDVAVHRFGCRDIKRAVNKAPFPRNYFIEEIDSKREHWLNYNSDFIEEGGEDNAWPMHFYPCTDGLPEGGEYGKA